MRRFLTLLSLFFSIICYGTDTLDSIFHNAGIAYEQGRFEDALESYALIIYKGFESSDLYYNMGNAAFRSNKLGFSVLYYEKALKLDPGNAKASKNLAYVSIYKEDQLESLPMFFLKSWILALYSIFPLQAWSYLSILLFALILFGTITYIFAGNLNIKKGGFFIAVFSLLFFFVAISAAINKNGEIINPVNAVVVAPSVVVKSSPSLSGTDLFILHEGTLIKLEDKVGDWIEIKISDGRVGWIPSASNAII